MSCNLQNFRNRVLMEARGWIGTPYRFQSSRKGVGCDCLGLIRGIWSDVYGHQAPVPGPYTSDWAEAGSTDQLMQAAQTYCGKSRPVNEAEPGDILVFRWRPNLPAKHLGILSADHRFIHAYSGVGVVESALVPGWRRRIAGVFVFSDPVKD